MRWQLPFLIALVACAADTESDEGARCEQGPGLHDDAVAALRAQSPGCTRDDQCVLLSTALHCEGFVLGDCGTIVHEDAVGAWDARAVCRQIEALPTQRDLVCESSPSCARPEPACIAGRCSSR